MTFNELKARREVILAIAERYGANDLRVLGSVVRGEADAAGAKPVRPRGLLMSL